MQFNSAYSEPIVQQQQPQQQWGTTINHPTVGSMQPTHIDTIGMPTTPTTSDDVLNTNVTAPSSYNQRTSERMRQDEGIFFKSY